MFRDTSISGIKIFEPAVFKDDRGYFFESYNKNAFIEAGITDEFVQDNQSFSEYGVLRGLHFQKGEYAQAKLVRVLSGKVLDVCVDLRKDSNTFGQSFSIELSDQNNKQVYIPRGFAHGFLVLSKTALFSYKCDNFYHKASESGIVYNDPQLNIDWIIPKEDLKINTRDLEFPTLDKMHNTINTIYG